VKKRLAPNKASRMRIWHSTKKRRAINNLWLVPLALASYLLNAVAGPPDERVVLLPQLHNGETFLYESHAILERHVQTKSHVATMLRPGELRRNLSTSVRLSVQEARPVNDKLFMAAESELLRTDPSAINQGRPPKPTKVSFTIGGDGSVTRAEGLDELDAEQLLTWQFWVAQFAFGWTLPPAGVKPGDKWKSEEPERTPTAIANLVWERETTYVQNEKCPILRNQQCAVFLVSSTLKQKSNPKDTTPEDYQLHQLKTSGTAKGTNETVAYISLQTGLLVRATEDLQQFMNVTIAKADDSNQIHYDMQVTSHFETTVVPKP
jgi:hypothetical protein